MNPEDAKKLLDEVARLQEQVEELTDFMNALKNTNEAPKEVIDMIKARIKPITSNGETGTGSLSAGFNTYVSVMIKGQLYRVLVF